jgi:CubicO group peptidase (beta-lactamase class C family)
MKRLILFVVVLSYSISLIAQSTNLQVKQKPQVLQNAKPEAAGFSAERLKRIDKNINDWIADGRLNGAVALIVHDGKIVYHKAFGYDDVEKPNRFKLIIFIA